MVGRLRLLERESTSRVMRGGDVTRSEVAELSRETLRTLEEHRASIYALTCWMAATVSIGFISPMVLFILVLHR